MPEYVRFVVSSVYISVPAFTSAVNQESTLYFNDAFIKKRSRLSSERLYLLIQYGLLPSLFHHVIWLFSSTQFSKSRISRVVGKVYIPRAELLLLLPETGRLLALLRMYCTLASNVHALFLPKLVTPRSIMLVRLSLAPGVIDLLFMFVTEA